MPESEPLQPQTDGMSESVACTAGSEPNPSVGEGRRSLYWVALLTCIGVGLLVLRKYPLGAPGQEAFFYRDGVGEALRYSFIFLGTVNGLLLVFLIRDHARLPKWGQIVLISVFAVTLNLWLYRPLHFSWSSRLIPTASSGISCFFTQGHTIQSVSGYPRQHVDFAGRGYASVPTWSKRLTTYPPGLPVVYWLIHRVSSLPGLRRGLVLLGEYENSADFDINQIVVPESLLPPAVLANLFYLAALGAIPLLVYGITRQLSGHGAAARAAAYAALIPACQLFTTAEAILLAPIGLCVILLCVTGIQRESPRLMFVCGLMCGVAVFMSFTLLPFLLCTFLLICIRTLDRSSVLARLLCSWVVGGGLIYVVGLLFSYDAARMLLVAARNNAEFYRLSGRGYLESVPFNVAEVVVFCGIPWALCFFVSCIASFRDFYEVWRRGGDVRGLAALPLRQVLPAVVGLVIALMLLSGGARGEVGRNWLPLMPIMVIASVTDHDIAARDRVAFGVLGVFYLLVCSILIEISFGFWTA